MQIPWGTTSQIVEVRVLDYSSPAGGQGKGLTTLTKDTTNLSVTYSRLTSVGSAPADIAITPLETMSRDVYTARGFTHVGDGVYQVGVPNSAWVEGAREVRVSIQSSGGEVTGLTPTHRVVDLYDPFLENIKDDITNLKHYLANRILYQGTVGSGSTASIINDATLATLTPDVNHWQYRTVFFPATTTTSALRLQARDIAQSSGIGLVMDNPFTRAPVAGDSFEIV